MKRAGFIGELNDILSAMDDILSLGGTYIICVRMKRDHIRCYPWRSTFAISAEGLLSSRALLHFARLALHSAEAPLGVTAFGVISRFGKKGVLFLRSLPA